MCLPNIYPLFLMSEWKIMQLVVTNSKMRCSNSQHTSHKSKLPTGICLNCIKKRTWLGHSTFARMFIPLLRWPWKCLACRSHLHEQQTAQKTQQTIGVTVLIISCLGAAPVMVDTGILTVPTVPYCMDRIVPPAIYCIVLYAPCRTITTLSCYMDHSIPPAKHCDLLVPLCVQLFYWMLFLLVSMIIRRLSHVNCVIIVS